MPEKSTNGKVSGAFKARPKTEFGNRPKPKVQERSYKMMPLYMYRFKDMIRGLVSNQNFPDALAAIFTLAAVASALPFFPLPILGGLGTATFLLTYAQPLLGLMLLLFATFPMFLYQVPLIAWLFIFFMSLALFLGYKHYRSIIFIFALLALPFSSIGYILEIPIFVVTILTIGFKRGAIAAVLAVLVIAASSGMTGLHNAGSIAYNSNLTFAQVSASQAAQYLVPAKPILTLTNFGAGFSQASGAFFSYGVIARIFTGAYYGFSAIASNIILVLMQLIVWVFVAFAISSYAVKSRSKLRGTEASLFSIALPISYIGLSYISGLSFDPLVLVGFAITPAMLLVLEYNDITVVRALDVMKQDFRSRFGEAFEDLTTGTKETLDDVANYDQTKQELREAILAPIEKRELAGAYNIKPPKGILLFGPPGTGKTYLMRAVANELRAGFFYVKASQILSPYPGASAQTIEKIFSTARKHTPAIIFIDEIDSIASNREIQDSETGRQMLSTLLSEMDGFQKLEGVVIVGATNVPQMLDPSIMRSGRFDKILYIPLPDPTGREKIFQYYFRHLPISPKMDLHKLAEITDRYSGADIKNLVENVSRAAADAASNKNRTLEITMADMVAVIKVTKPSTSLAQVDKYNIFKVDYERRTHHEHFEESENKISAEDVIGLEDAKKAIHEAVELPILHPELIKKYDIKSIKGILLFGPPGTGKTMLMRAVASEISDVQLITLSGGEISKYGPERTLESIRQSFDRAKENSPSIIFVDEIDAIVPSRDLATEKGVQFTGEFLSQMDGLKSQYNIVIVCSTNRPDSLDPALLRPGRIDKIIYVGPPSKEERAKIFELNLKKSPMAGGVDFQRLAEMTIGFTGADIANICRQVKMNTLERSISSTTEQMITMEELTKLVQSTRPSAPSLVIGKYLSFLSKYGQR